MSCCAIIFVSLHSYFSPSAAYAAPWSPSHNQYGQRKQLTLVNNSGQTFESGTTYKITIDTQSLVNSGSVLTSCDDLRVVYQPSDTGATELKRNLEYASTTIGVSTCATSSATKLVFQLQANIANSATDANYYLYFDNPRATTYPAADALAAYNVGSKTATFVAPFNGTTTAIAAGSGTPTTESGAIRYSGGKSALSFDGGSDYVTTASGNVPNLYSDDFSLETWVYLNSYPTNQANVFWSQGSGSGQCSNGDSLSFTIHSNGKVGFTTYKTDYSYTSVITSSGTISLGSWTHLTLVYSNDSPSIYINGQQQALSGTWNITNLCNNSGNLELAGKWTSNNLSLLNGLLDETRVSNIARYNANFTPQTTPFVRDENTKLLLHLDENGDDPRNSGKAIDDSGNGNHGTITGAKYVSGLVGVDNASTTTGYQSSQSYAGHDGVYIEEGTTNKITNPSFDHSTYGTNWSAGGNSFSTFTPNIAKRNSSGPFANGALLQGDMWGDTNGDLLSFPLGSQVGSDLYNQLDRRQGTISFWYTPEFDSASDTSIHGLFAFSTDYAGIEMYYDSRDGYKKFAFGAGNAGAVYVAQTLTAGTTYLITARWATDYKLNGTNYLSLSVDDSHTFGVTSAPSITSTTANIRIGMGNSGGIGSADGIIEGFTIYRRPLYDGTYGIDAGNGDEINQIYNSGTGQDPTLVTGSWDVVFALPTNASTGTLGTTGEAWTHPHSSNLLYTSATNTGGFMMDGYYGGGKSVDFNGTSTYVNSGSDSALDDLQSNAFTAEGWVKLDWPSTSYTHFLNKGTYAASGWDIRWNANQRLEANVYTNGTDAYSQTNNQSFIPDYKWHHYAITYDNAGDRKIRIFWDGTEVTYNTQTAATGTIDSDASRDLLMGTAYGSGGFHKGSMGWQRVSNVVRYSSPFTPSNAAPTSYTNTIAQWNMSEGTGTTIDNAEGTAARDGTITSGSWSSWFTNEGTPTYGTDMGNSNRIFSGGIKITSDAVNEGMYYDKTVTGGDDFAVRAVAHSDGTCVPRVILYDQTGSTEIGHLDGATTNDRDTPAVLVFTGEMPSSGSRTLRVKLINTASSGTCYWHQVEVLSNLVNKPSLESGSGDPWIPDGWSAYGSLEAGDSSQSVGTTHSGSSALNITTSVTGGEWEGMSTNSFSITSGKYYSRGTWNDTTSAAYFRIEYGETASQYSSATSDEVARLTSDGYVWDVLRARSTRSSRIDYRKNGNISTITDDVYFFQLSDVTLTITPATSANSTESNRIRVDGNDTYTHTLPAPTTSSGTITFDYIPRHSAANVAKFSNTTPYIATLYGDSNDFIKLYWSAANTVKLEYQMNGGSVTSSTWDATGAISAGTTYDLEIAYTGGGNMTFKVDDVTKITLSSIPASFGTAPTTAYWGSDNSGGQQVDAVFLPQPLTSSANTTAPYFKFGTKSAQLANNLGGDSRGFVASINAGNTNTHTLSAYVYDGTSGNVGGTVSSSIAQLVFNGSAQTTTYTDMGGGWWRLSYAGTGIASSQSFGVQVKSGKTVYVDGVQLEEKAYATSYADGTMGTGYAWTGTANDSTSTRTKDTLVYQTSSNIDLNQGSISIWVKPKKAISSGQGDYNLFDTNGNYRNSLGAYADENFPGVYFYTYNSNVFSGGINNCGVTWTVDKWFHVVMTWSGTTLNCYANSVAATPSTRTSPTDTLSVINIGNHTNGDVNQTDSILSDVQIFSSAMTSTEVADLYYSGLGSHSSLAPTATERFTDGQPPVLAWHMNEGYGTTTYDSTIYQNSGTISGATWSDDSGQAGLSGSKSLKFDGSNDYVSRAYNNDTELAPGTNPFSVSTWFKHPSTISGTDTLISRYNGAGYKLYMNSSGYICFAVDDDSTWSPDDSACTTVSYADSTWHHVLAIKGNTTITVYIDGTQKATTTFTVSGSLSGNTPTLYTGVDSDGSSNPWDGFIDEVRIYDSVRSETQINQEFAAKGSVKGVSAQFGSGGAKDTLTQGLVGYWKMDEASWNGTAGEVIDASGNGNNGARSGDATTAAGKYGNGGTFDGNGDYVNIGQSQSLNVIDEFTMSTWVKTSDSVNNSGIVSKGSISIGGSTSLFYFGLSAGKVQGIYRALTNIVQSTSTVSDNAWHNITWTYSKLRGKHFIYIDGKLDAQGNAAQTTTTTDNSDVVIGRGDLFGDLYYYNGLTDEVKVYNRVLSQAEVRALYEYAPGPVAHYTFDEGSGQSAYDGSANGNTGTLGASSSVGSDDPTSTNGKYGKALSFDGSDDYVAGTNTSSVQTSKGTISAWIKTTNAGSSYRGIATKQFAYGMFLKDNVLMIYDWGSNTDRSTGINLADKSWHYVSVTFESGTSNGTKVWIDGNSVLTTTMTVSNQTVAVEVGRGGSSGGTDQLFNGSIDDVRIYNYTRSQKQLIQDMNAGHPAVGSPVGSPLVYYKFDEGTDNRCSGGVNDVCNSGSAGSALDGAQSGMAVPATSTSGWTNSGKFGKAMNFDGDGDYVSIPAISNLSSFSWSMWFKTNAVNNDNYLGARTTNVTTYIRKGVSCAQNKIDFGVNAGGWQGGCSNSTISADTWYHLVAVYDEINHKTYIYLNGRQDASMTTTGTVSTSSGGFNIGSAWDGVSNFDGSIDEVKIYSYALSEDEIKLEYNQGKSQVLGSLGTTTDGKTNSNSQSRAYCPPGNIEGNCAAGQNPAPVAEWNLDEGSGQSVNDIAGNANTGTLGSGGTADSADPTWVPGKIGKGLSFDGSDDYVAKTSSSIPVGANPWSASLWMRPRDSGQDSYLDVALSWGSHGGNMTSSRILARETDISWETYNGGVGGISGNFLNTWIHFEVTYDGTTVRTYANGVYKASNNYTLGIDNSDLYVGRGLAGREYMGDIDQVRIYNYARTPSQVAWDYNHGAPVAWYKMDECSGTTLHSANETYNSALDATIYPVSNDNTAVGTCGSGITTDMWNDGSTGKFNGSLGFDGNDDYAQTSTPVTTQTSNISFSAWIYATNNWGTIVPFYNGNASANGYGFLISNGSCGNGSILSILTGGVACNVTNSTYTVPTNQWILATGTYDGSTWKLYVDGVLKSSGSSTPGTPTTSTSVGNGLTGQIDDARIYNYVLSDQQVKLIYNGGSAVSFK